MLESQQQMTDRLAKSKYPAATEKPNSDGAGKRRTKIPALAKTTFADGLKNREGTNTFKPPYP
jgi:hypothetical protein